MIKRFLAASVVALAVATGFAAAESAASASPSASTRSVVAVAPACASGYYKNVDGVCVRRPSTSPRGATAKCRDGTYSYSTHAAGTCSHHGGVARWIRHP
jgi:hypothetical protein